MPWQGQTNDFPGLIWSRSWKFPTPTLKGAREHVCRSLLEVMLESARANHHTWKRTVLTASFFTEPHGELSLKTQ